MKYTEIQWIPFAPNKKKWWVFEHESEEGEIPVTDIEGDENSNSFRPTGRIVGQFVTITEAMAAYPDAKISEHALKAWENPEQPH